MIHSQNILDDSKLPSEELVEIYDKILSLMPIDDFQEKYNISNYIFSAIYVDTFTRINEFLNCTDNLDKYNNSTSIFVGIEHQRSLNDKFLSMIKHTCKIIAEPFLYWLKENLTRFDYRNSIHFSEIDFIRPSLSCINNYFFKQSGTSYPQDDVTIIQIYHCWFQHKMCLDYEHLWDENLDICINPSTIGVELKNKFPSYKQYEPRDLHNISDIFMALHYRWHAYNCYIDMYVRACETDKLIQDPWEVTQEKLYYIHKFCQDICIDPIKARFEYYMYSAISTENPMKNANKGDPNFISNSRDFHITKRLEILMHSESLPQTSMSFRSFKKHEDQFNNYKFIYSRGKKKKEYFNELYDKEYNSEKVELKLNYFWIDGHYLQLLDMFMFEKLFGICFTLDQFVSFTNGSDSLKRRKDIEEKVSSRFNSKYLTCLASYFNRTDVTV